MGRLTRDPEVRYQQANNLAVARFTLAVDRRYKQDGDGQTADFISCVAFGKTGEFAEKYLRQGTKIVVEGRIQTGSYTNKDGVKVYTTDIVVEQMEFAEKKSSGQTTGSRPTPEDAQAPVDADGFMNIPEGAGDGIPFS